MQEIKKDHIIPQPSSFSWISSITIFVITLIAIIAFYVFQYMSISSIKNSKVEIAKLDAIIQSWSLDKDVIVYNIMKSTVIKPSMDLKWLVRDFRLTAANSGLRFSWFNISNDILTTKMIATQDSLEIDPVETVIQLMRTPDSKTAFSLEPIYWLEGSPSERSTAISFRILPPKLVNNVTK